MPFSLTPSHTYSFTLSPSLLLFLASFSLTPCSFSVAPSLLPSPSFLPLPHSSFSPALFTPSPSPSPSLSRPFSFFRSPSLSHSFVFSPPPSPKIHCWDNGTPLEETLRALNDLVVCGKVRYVGVSNVTGWQFQKIIDMSSELGLNKIVSNQVYMAVGKVSGEGKERQRKGM